jgi:hypothetical protein
MCDEEMGGLSRDPIGSRSRVPSQEANLVEVLCRLHVERYDPFGVELSQGHMEGPTVLGEFLQGIDLEVEELLDPESSCPQEEQSRREEPASAAEFLLEGPIGVFGERSRELSILRWRVAPSEQWLLRSTPPAPSSDVLEEAPNQYDRMSSRSFLKRPPIAGFPRGEMPQPRFDVRALEL